MSASMFNVRSAYVPNSIGNLLHRNMSNMMNHNHVVKQKLDHDFFHNLGNNHTWISAHDLNEIVNIEAAVDMYKHL